MTGNDYGFGNRLTRLRERAGLTQRELGERLDVSAKAVSKWENGRAKPATDTLRRLSALFGVPVETLLAGEKGEGKSITKIVITGGPCAGKTTAMSWVNNYFTARGYTVLFVPETATELITGGVAPWTCGTNREYQNCQMQLQLFKERVFEDAASGMPAEKILIVCDRGAMDNRAYMSQLDFEALTGAMKTSEVELRDRYDAVFHLVTAAKGANAFYTTDNNAARRESPEDAAALDDRLIDAWTGHPHLRVIGNETDFESKMKRLLSEIAAFMGVPEPLEIERKFLIEYPDEKTLRALPNCRRVEIIQTYLCGPRGVETRVRQRGSDGHYLFYETTKKRVSPVKRIEVERRLSEGEYIEKLMEADPDYRQIKKARYCVAYKNQYMEIDLFPFWKDKAILEVELRSEEQPIEIPDFLKVIREVTDEEAFTNHSLAKIQG